MTQFISSLVIYFVGDMVAQSISTPDKPAVSGNGEGSLATTVSGNEVAEEDEDARGWVQAWMEDRDWARTARALFIGGAAAVPGYRWFLWLSNSFNYSSKILSLTTKVCLALSPNSSIPVPCPSLSPSQNPKSDSHANNEPNRSP
jgi:hypothetical protein